MRFVVRPLLSFIVLTALVLALLQGGGRVAFGLLAHLEVAANQLLADRQIRVSGLRGDWRWFNPIVRIERLELPAGHIEDLFVEFDLFQTLLQGRAVLYRGRVAGSTLLIEKMGAGSWRLAGMPAGRGFDPLPFITDPDQLQLHGSLAFVRDDGPAAVFEMDYVGSNRDGGARHRLILRNGVDDCTAPCELRIEADLQEGAWAIRDAETTLTVSATNFVVGQPLLGFATMQLDALEVDWQGSEETSSGRALLLASGALAVDGRPFEARMGAVSRGNNGRHWGQVNRLEITQGGERLDLPTLTVDVGDGLLHASILSVPVGELTRLLASVLAGNEVASRWLDALELDAEIDDLHAFYRFATREVGYSFAVAMLDMNGYRGVPWIRRGTGSVLGYTQFHAGRPLAQIGHALEIEIDATDMGLAFPEQVRGDWRLPYARGRLLAWFRRNEFRMRGLELAARIGESELRGSVGIAQLAEDERDRRLAVLAQVDRMTVAEARRFVPYTLPPRTYTWLTETPMDGAVHDAHVAYQGQFRAVRGGPGRRLEIAGDVEDGGIRFLPEWPEVRAFAGRLELAGREVRAMAERAECLGADLAGTRIRLRDNGAVADVALTARADAAQVLALVRQSPLQNAMPFVTSDWAGSGPLEVTGELSIPVREFARLKEQSAAAGSGTAKAAVPDGFAIDLAVALDGVDLDLPRYRLAFGELAGPLQYGFPATLESAGIDGTLFDAPVRVTANSVDNRLRLAFSGTARHGDFWRVIDVRDMGLAEGATRFDALLDLEAPAGAGARRADAPPPMLTVHSDLTGMALRLPGEYGKPAAEAVATEASIAMPGDERRLTFGYRSAQGWMRFAKRLLQGVIGLGVEPPPLPTDDAALVFTGRIDRLGLDDLALGAGSTAAFALPVRVRDFTVDRLLLGNFVVADARLEADVDTRGFEVEVESDALTGSARRQTDPALPADAGTPPIELAVAELRLPAATGRGDPIAPEVIKRIPAMDVDIEAMTVGDADYGRWRFRVRSEGGDLHFRDLEARLRKVDIASSDGIVWRGATNETTFAGRLEMANLAEVLPLWGYAPNVETERATLTGTMTWPGSPASFDLLALSGEADAWARSGRFLEVESGGGTQRILSLLNFTTIAKRISLDFSDVFGKGLSFDKLKATFTLDRGMLELVKPLDVEGTGLKFKLYGTVNMTDRVLDHEMIVTLPVSRGLPWYAAYIALANPIAGLGVLVGERVLRKPLEQFSSARYAVTGTVENPEVKLVSVFAGGGDAADRPVEVPVEVPAEGQIEVQAEGQAEGQAEQKGPSEPRVDDVPAPESGTPGDAARTAAEKRAATIDDASTTN